MYFFLLVIVKFVGDALTTIIASILSLLSYVSMHYAACVDYVRW